MFRRGSESSQSNFWISYADLMAGLLFVFILLIGAIVSKSVIMREDLHKKENRLEKAESSLAQKKERLNLTQEKLKELTKELNNREAILRDMNSTLLSSKQKIAKQKKIMSSSKKVIEKQNKIVSNQKKTISGHIITITEQKEKIRLQEEEVKKLHRLLAELQSTIKSEKLTNKILSDKLSLSDRKLTQVNKILLTEKELGKTRDDRIEQLQSLITLTKDSLKLKENELEKLNQLLLARNSKIDTLSKKVVLLQNLTQSSDTTLEEKEKKLQEYKNRVIVLSNSLTKKEDELALKDQKLADMLDALDKKRTKYDSLVAKLQAQKAKIKSLTGIKLKVIAALKETLGDRINIDKSSGALRLSSNILFDRGSSELKDASKLELQRAFEEYIGALVSNEAIRPHLDRIVVEGHTDSDGTYLYNLKLSQQRALAVMNYLLTLPIAKKYDLKKYLVASGRAYLDSIKTNGVENKEASRRIEIKFQLKNQDAMHEIERILDDGKRLF